MSWESKTLGEISLSIQTGPFGSQLHQSDYSDDGTPVVMPKDLMNGTISEESIARVSKEHVERLEKHKIQEGDILYSRRGDVGRCAFTSEREKGWLCGTGCLKVRIDKEKAEPKFVFFQLQKAETIGWVVNHAVGSTMLNLNTSILNAAPVEVPEIEIQRKIVSILAAYDELIENNRKQIKLLEEAARRLYKEWFVDLHFPGYEDVEIVDGLPEGWVFVSINMVAKLKAGGDKPKTFSEKMTNENKIPVFANGITEKGLMGFTDKAVINNPSVTISARGTVGVVFLRTEPYVPIVRLISVTPIDDKIDILYLFLYLANQNFRSTGAAQQQITVPLLKSKNIVCPTDDVRKSFNDVITPIFNKIEILEKQIDFASEARDRLLPKLMSGEIEV